MSQEMLIINNPDRRTLRIGELLFSYEFFKFFNAKEMVGRLFRFDEVKDGVIKVSTMDMPLKSGKHWATKDLVAVGLIAFAIAFVGGLMAGAVLR